MVQVCQTRQAAARLDPHQGLCIGVPRRGDGGPGDLDNTRDPVGSSVDRSGWRGQGLRGEPRPHSNRLQGEDRLAHHDDQLSKDVGVALSPTVRSRLLAMRLRSWPVGTSSTSSNGLPFPGGRGEHPVVIRSPAGSIGCTASLTARSAASGRRRARPPYVVPGEAPSGSKTVAATENAPETPGFIRGRPGQPPKSFLSDSRKPPTSGPCSSSEETRWNSSSRSRCFAVSFRGTSTTTL